MVKALSDAAGVDCCCGPPPPVFTECPDPCPCTGDLHIELTIELHCCDGMTGQDLGCCFPCSCGSAEVTIPWHGGFTDCTWGGQFGDPFMNWPCDNIPGLSFDWLFTAGCATEVCAQFYDPPRWRCLAPGQGTQVTNDCWVGGGFNCTGTTMVEQNYPNLPPPSNQTSCGGVCHPNDPNGNIYCTWAMIQHTMTLSL